MPPIIRKSRYEWLKTKTEAVVPPDTSHTSGTGTPAKVESHVERIQNYQSQVAASAGYRYIASDSPVLGTKSKPIHSVNHTRPTSSLSSRVPWKSVALKGPEVLGLWNHFWGTKDSENGQALNRLSWGFRTGELLNWPLFLWLKVSPVTSSPKPSPHIRSGNHDYWVLVYHRYGLGLSIHNHCPDRGAYYRPSQT